MAVCSPIHLVGQVSCVVVCGAAGVPPCSQLCGSVWAAGVPPCSQLCGSVWAAGVPPCSQLCGSVWAAGVPPCSQLCGSLWVGMDVDSYSLFHTFHCLVELCLYGMEKMVHV